MSRFSFGVQRVTISASGQTTIELVAVQQAQIGIEQNQIFRRNGAGGVTFVTRDTPVVTGAIQVSEFPDALFQALGLLQTDAGSSTLGILPQPSWTITIDQAANALDRQFTRHVCRGCNIGQITQLAVIQKAYTAYSIPFVAGAPSIGVGGAYVAAAAAVYSRSTIQAPL